MYFVTRRIELLTDAAPTIMIAPMRLAGLASHTLQWRIHRDFLFLEQFTRARSIARQLAGSAIRQLNRADSGLFSHVPAENKIALQNGRPKPDRIQTRL
jgi:hypothetical protein